MESPNQGRRKSARLMKQTPTASSSRTKNEEEKKVIEKKVVPGSSKGEVDSIFSGLRTAEEKAMGISLILQGVISEMNTSNLKNSRLVSKTWKEEADKEITRRDCFRLKFDPETRPLKKGLKELKFSRDLPCLDLNLTVSEKTEGLKEIEKLVSLFGSRIKSLTLKSEINGKSLSTLLIGLPKLEKLFVSSGFIEWGRFGKSTPKAVLPDGALSNLKQLTYLYPVLHIGRGSKVFEIIDKAPNLQSINNVVFADELLRDDSTWTEKTHLLKSFECEPDATSNSEMKIENLYLKFESCKQELVRKIVKSSEDTLKTLVTISTFITLPKKGGFGPLFLPFQNLKVLQVWIDQEMWINFADSTFESKNLTQFRQQAFPSLTTVILELPSLPSVSSRKQKYSPFKNSIESVENLELRSQSKGQSWWRVDEKRMRRIKKLFPNVKHLKLMDSPEIPQILPFCFANWPGMESLELHINFEEPICMDRSLENPYFDAMKIYQNLDSIFTGLPVEMCKRLGAAKPGKELKKDIEVAQDINSEHRAKKSLVFLTELKKLDIVFDDIRPGISETKCPISSISCFYAFKLMPNLKVRILYDQNLAKFNSKTRTFENQYKMEKYLEDLEPHCEIGHWERDGVASYVRPRILGLISCSRSMPTYDL